VAMDPVQMLLDDHEKVRTLYRQYQQSSDNQQKHQVARQILTELEAHSKVEEQAFYPAVEQQGNSQLKQVVHHSEEEHQKVDQMIMKLKGMGSFSQEFDTQFTQLMSDVEHHVQEEESEMLPQARQILGGQTDQLSQQMQQIKQQTLSSSVR
jgi:hemerythrin superfamily protein